MVKIMAMLYLKAPKGLLPIYLPTMWHENNIFSKPFYHAFKTTILDTDYLSLLFKEFKANT